MRRVSMKMTDWIEKLHGFLSLNNREILARTSKVSASLPKTSPNSNTKSSTSNGSN
jgi:hypothetical protein